MRASILMITCALVYYSYGAVVGSPKEKLTKGVILGKCECGVFTSKVLEANQTPVIKQNPMNVTCDNDDGRCHLICTGLAQAAKAEGPSLVCTHVEKINKLQPSVFTRICNGEWNYTGLTGNASICCDHHKVIPCEQDEATQVETETCKTCNTESNN